MKTNFKYAKHYCTFWKSFPISSKDFMMLSAELPKDLIISWLSANTVFFCPDLNGVVGFVVVAEVTTYTPVHLELVGNIFSLLRI